MCCSLVTGPLAAPASSRPTPSATTYEDPDDTPGKLDLASVKRTVKKSAGTLFVHELTTYEGWDEEEFYVWIELWEREPQFEGCYEGRCTGLWEGAIYWDDENQELAGYMFEVTDCGDCESQPIEVWRSGDKSVAFSLYPSFFYPDTRSYDISFRTYWRDRFRLEASPFCRVDHCVDRLPDHGTVSFPLRSGRST
jgi:hypothetical protein